MLQDACQLQRIHTPITPVFEVILRARRSGYQACIFYPGGKRKYFPLTFLLKHTRHVLRLLYILYIIVFVAFKKSCPGTWSHVNQIQYPEIMWRCGDTATILYCHVLSFQQRITNRKRERSSNVAPLSTQRPFRMIAKTSYGLQTQYNRVTVCLLMHGALSLYRHGVPPLNRSYDLFSTQCP